MTTDLQPESVDSERTVLGAMLVDRELIAEMTATLKAADFYAFVHVDIFEAIRSLFDAGNPTEKFAVAQVLKQRNLLEKCGGISYLNALMDTVQTSASARYYAKLIREKAVLRRLVLAGKKIYELGLNGEADVSEAVAQAERELAGALSGIANTDRGQTLQEALLDVWREIDSTVAGKGKARMTTPWPRVDGHTGGAFPGEMVVCAAAPGMGKSIAVAQIALHGAQHHGQVALFALEMGTLDTVRRMLGKEAGVSSRRIRAGDLNPYQYDRIAGAMETLGALPITIFNKFPRKSVADLRRGLLLMSQRDPVRSVIVDHANFLSDANADSKLSKHERLDRLYQELLMIAAEFQCVMYVVQHLNREGMKGRPSLDNLRDGGNLEGHAHAVIFPYRASLDQEYGEFIIAKNRDGKAGTVAMEFDGRRLEWREQQEEAA